MDAKKPSKNADRKAESLWEVFTNIKVNLNGETDTNSGSAMTKVIIHVYNQVHTYYSSEITRHRSQVSEDTIRTLSFYCEKLIVCLKHFSLIDFNVISYLLIPLTLAITQFLSGSKNVVLPIVNWKQINNANVLAQLDLAHEGSTDESKNEIKLQVDQSMIDRVTKEALSAVNASSLDSELTQLSLQPKEEAPSQVYTPCVRAFNGHGYAYGDNENLNDVVMKTKKANLEKLHCPSISTSAQSNDSSNDRQRHNERAFAKNKSPGFHYQRGSSMDRTRGQVLNTSSNKINCKNDYRPSVSRSNMSYRSTKIDMAYQKASNAKSNSSINYADAVRFGAAESSKVKDAHERNKAEANKSMNDWNSETYQLKMSTWDLNDAKFVDYSESKQNFQRESPPKTEQSTNEILGTTMWRSFQTNSAVFTNNPTSDTVDSSNWPKDTLGNVNTWKEQQPSLNKMNEITSSVKLPERRTGSSDEPNWRQRDGQSNRVVGSSRPTSNICLKENLSNQLNAKNAAQTADQYHSQSIFSESSLESGLFNKTKLGHVSDETLKFNANQGAQVFGLPNEVYHTNTYNKSYNASVDNFNIGGAASGVSINQAFRPSSSFILNKTDDFGGANKIVPSITRGQSDYMEKRAAQFVSNFTNQTRAQAMHSYIQQSSNAFNQFGENPLSHLENVKMYGHVDRRGNTFIPSRGDIFSQTYVNKMGSHSDSNFYGGDHWKQKMNENVGNFNESNAALLGAPGAEKAAAKKARNMRNKTCVPEFNPLGHNHNPSNLGLNSDSFSLDTANTIFSSQDAMGQKDNSKIWSESSNDFGRNNTSSGFNNPKSDSSDLNSRIEDSTIEAVQNDASYGNSSIWKFPKQQDDAFGQISNSLDDLSLKNTKQNPGVIGDRSSRAHSVVEKGPKIREDHGIADASFGFNCVDVPVDGAFSNFGQSSSSYGNPVNKIYRNPGVIGDRPRGISNASGQASKMSKQKPANSPVYNLSTVEDYFGAVKNARNYGLGWYGLDANASNPRNTSGHATDPFSANVQGSNILEHSSASQNLAFKLSHLSGNVLGPRNWAGPSFNANARMFPGNQIPNLNLASGDASGPRNSAGPCFNADGQMFLGNQISNMNLSSGDTFGKHNSAWPSFNADGQMFSGNLIPNQNLPGSSNFDQHNSVGPSFNANAHMFPRNQIPNMNLSSGDAFGKHNSAWPTFNADGQMFSGNQIPNQNLASGDAFGLGNSAGPSFSADGQMFPGNQMINLNFSSGDAFGKHNSAWPSFNADGQMFSGNQVPNHNSPSSSTFDPRNSAGPSFSADGQMFLGNQIPNPNLPSSSTFGPRNLAGPSFNADGQMLIGNAAFNREQVVSNALHQSNSAEQVFTGLDHQSLISELASPLERPLGSVIDQHNNYNSNPNAPGSSSAGNPALQYKGSDQADESSTSNTFFR